MSDSMQTVIFGGNTGIGKAIAEALAPRGGAVFSLGRSNGVDVSNAATVENWFLANGEVDNVIFTAGSQAPGGKVSELDIDAAKTAFEIKFWGSVKVAQIAAKYIRTGGTLTLTSGFLARKTVPGTFVKTTMNAALEAGVKILARELAPVRVNIVSPGLTDTEAYSGMGESDRNQMFANAAKALPVGRVASPQDVAQGYLFAIDCPSITGAVIDIDGGALIS